MSTKPQFTQGVFGEAVENQGDEERILNDQDETAIDSNPASLDENMGARSYGIDRIENEPEDFMQGEVDVKTQMDRAAREMDAAIQGRRGPDPDVAG